MWKLHFEAYIWKLALCCVGCGFYTSARSFLNHDSKVIGAVTAYRSLGFSLNALPGRFSPHSECRHHYCFHRWSAWSFHQKGSQHRGRLPQKPSWLLHSASSERVSGTIFTFAFIYRVYLWLHHSTAFDKEHMGSCLYFHTSPARTYELHKLMNFRERKKNCSFSF